MPIQKTTAGLMDYCIDKLEQIEADKDIPIERKLHYGTGFIREMRELAKVELSFKRLATTAPRLASERAIVHLGSPANADDNTHTGEPI